jgi:threonine dehydrogenase-like Zn-dependent dehydrogenase
MNKDGTMAEYLTLPVRNLHLVPDSVSDEEAVFTEPLAAACRVVEQGLAQENDRVAVLGDGKLGLMVSGLESGT